MATSGDDRMNGHQGSNRLVDLVDTYCRRVYPAVLSQHEGTSVSSPLGVWLLLAACASTPKGSRLEPVLGCSAAEASQLLSSFLADPPPALRTALALWVAADDTTPALDAWSAALPPAVETGALPSRQEVDAWAERQTLGLMKHFPMEMNPLTRLTLASALATKISWKRPLTLLSSDDALKAGPWAGQVQQVLGDYRPKGNSMLATTRAAGVVAVHTALAAEEAAVVSVSADPTVAREAVLAGAHEVASMFRGLPVAAVKRSLFDVPLGEGHSWVISEQPTGGYDHDEWIMWVTLPAWKAEGTLDLRTSDLFGTDPALTALLDLIGPHPKGDKLAARQAAMASYTQYGFEAGGISGLDAQALAMTRPLEEGLERSAELRFDHPYAVLALAGRAESFTGHNQVKSRLFGLPLFSAWIATPEEPEPDSYSDPDLTEWLEAHPPSLLDFG